MFLKYLAVTHLDGQDGHNSAIVFMWPSGCCTSASSKCGTHHMFAQVPFQYPTGCYGASLGLSRLYCEPRTHSFLPFERLNQIRKRTNSIPHSQNQLGGIQRLPPLSPLLLPALRQLRKIRPKKAVIKRPAVADLRVTLALSLVASLEVFSGSLSSLRYFSSF